MKLGFTMHRPFSHKLVVSSPRTNSRGAVLVAVGISCFVSWTCVEQVKTVLEIVALSQESDDRTLAVRALEAGRATLSALVPLLLVFLFAAWSAAGRGLLVARTAVVAAVGIWLTSLTILKYLVPTVMPAS